MRSKDTREIATQNGQTICATFFHPQGEVKASALIVPALGISQRYYAAFANWLAAQGFFVATFDYSGMGKSRRTDLRNVKVNMMDWGRFDCDAMVDAVSVEAPGKPIYWLGHSLGGQLFGLVSNQGRITKVVTIATGSGYWRENSPSLKRRVWWLWYVVAPLATRIFGYFPGKRLRKVGDMPRSVMEQWRKWCLHPDYLVGVEGDQVKANFAAVKIPITSLSFADDELLSTRNVESLHEFYTDAPKVMKRIAPEEVQTKRIGHFGFFRARFKESLWRNYLLPELA